MLDTSHSSLFGPTYALYRGSAAQVRIRWYYTVPLRSPHQITLQAMPTPKLLDQVRTVIRVRHFSLSTERAYVSWIRRFILFHNKRHPNQMAEAEIRQFISHLAVDAKLSASTQTVALSALLFLYRDVLMMTSNAHSGLSTQHSALSTQDSALSTQHDASCTRSSSDSKHV